MSTVNISVITKDDWSVYKSLRLRSLQESPDSFGSTYENELYFSDEEWLSRLNVVGRERNVLPLIAEVNGNPSGVAWALVHDVDTKTAYVYQMWVAPEARGTGIGRALLKHIITWAESASLDRVTLAVTTTNSAALGLYESLGFVPHGDVEALRLGSVLNVQPMILQLRANAV